MTPLAKATIALSTMGAIGGLGAYHGWLFESPKKEPKIVKVTISARLEKEGFTVLNPDATEGWADVWKAYQSDSKKDFLDSTKTKEEDLKNKCKEVLDLKDDDSNYSKAKRWCVKKQNIEAILTKAGYKKLNSKDPAKSEEQEAWNKKIEELKVPNVKSFEGLVEKVKAEEDSANKVKALRDECEKINVKAIETTSEEFETKFGLVKEWCSIQKITK